MESLINELKMFAKQRDWEQYHSPKNLAMALNIETAELLEIFLWLTDEQSDNLDEKKLTNLKEEIGDVMIYLTNLASKFDLDPIQCAKDKLKLNKKKYPADIVKGSAKKYT